ncbi:MAG: DUF87 domain-containing protein, partial [Geminicoccaceae bacterium]|nr:DUF87 domain-containing protein [Geminicoccaceae bacterium]
MLFNRFRFQPQQGFGKRPADRPAFQEPHVRPAAAPATTAWAASPNGTAANLPRIHGRPPEPRIARAAVARPVSVVAERPVIAPEAPRPEPEASPAPVDEPALEPRQPARAEPELPDDSEPVGHARTPNNVALALQQAFEDEMASAGDLPDVEAEPAVLIPEATLEEEARVADEFEDVAVTIGRVVSIRGPVVWGALYDDPEGTTARAARMGALVSMRGPDSRVFGVVNALERDQQSGGKEHERTIFEIQILGEISNHAQDAGFQRGVSSYPPLDAPITTVTLRDLAKVYARPKASCVHVGRLRHNQKVPAFVLTDSLLGKHFAILGTTGSGKSCAVTVILRSILDEYPEGHVVLIDPHNEYAQAFADRAELLDPSNLKLPYWLLNFEEISQILIGGAGERDAHAKSAILKDAILRARATFTGEEAETSGLTVDTPVPYRLSDLIQVLKEGMGMLNKTDPSAPYLSLIGRIEGLRNDPRYAFMFQSLTVRDNMRQILAQLLRVPVEGKPITIIDISGVPSEIVDVVVSVLFRLTFELGVWSERGTAPPVLLVCEEAHRYVPAGDATGFLPTKRVISRIAKEGRKYGVTLCLVSQRPSELAIGSLSQCNTVFA